MLYPLRRLFDQFVASGNLTVIDCFGLASEFGDGTGPRIVVQLADRRVELRLLLDPGLAFGEAYMDGLLTLRSGSIYDLVALVLRNLEAGPGPASMRLLYRMRFLFRRLQQFNAVSRARRNVRHHYDIDSFIYDLFLDPDHQYSCAYFEHQRMGLEEAQEAKKRHLAAKLDLSDGMRILDIGSGWGGLSLSLARLVDVEVTGVTLSNEQLKLSRQRAKTEDLSSRVRFELQDYRDIEGQFDRIVSVGMFEHVGVSFYPAFFAKLRELLAPDGVALIHAIGRFDGPAATNPFIRKYVFPGGYVPALSEVFGAVEKSGLLVTDVEILRLHYAKTLHHWRARFVSHWREAAERMGERFCRLWEFYLAVSEAAFRYQHLMVFQIQLAKKLEALPLTRDYMLSAERKLRMETGRATISSLAVNQ